MKECPLKPVPKKKKSYILTLIVAFNRMRGTEPVWLRMLDLIQLAFPINTCLHELFTK